MIFPLVIFTLKFGNVGLGAIINDTHTLTGGDSTRSIEHWMSTFSILLNTFILPIYILVVLSIGVFVFDGIKNKKFNNKILFFLLWIFWWYISFTWVIGVKGDIERCCIYPAAAIAAIAVWPIMIYKNKIIRWGMIIFVLIICAYQGFLSYNQTYSYVNGYEYAAKYVMDNYKGKTILFSGYYDGNFIFNVRKHDNDKKAIVLRDSKILVSWSVFREWGYRSYVNTEEDIYKILNKYGTKYIVVEDKEIQNEQAFKILRNMLKKDDFTLEKTIKIKSNMRKISGISILIYKYKKEPTDVTDNLTIDFPLLKRKINVPLVSLSSKGLK